MTAVAYGRKYAAGKPGDGMGLANIDQMVYFSSVSKRVTGSVECSNTGMGKDPAEGFYKYCKCLKGLIVLELPCGHENHTSWPYPSQPPHMIADEQAEADYQAMLSKACLRAPNCVVCKAAARLFSSPSKAQADKTTATSSN